MIAPILLPVLALLSSLTTTPAPILEWNVKAANSHSCALHLEIAHASHAELSKLSLLPVSPGIRMEITSFPAAADDHWTQNSALNWMWRQAPTNIQLDVHLDWGGASLQPNLPFLDVEWEQISDGERKSWLLGSLETPPIQTTNSIVEPNFEAKRTATLLSPNVVEVQLHVSKTPERSFVKWTEYIPEGCTCEILEASGASLRATNNAQIFLWFEATQPAGLHPTYRMTCASTPASWGFDGELEVAFGTQTKTLHIAEVEWEVPATALNENMRLNQSSDNQSVDASSVSNTFEVKRASEDIDVRYAVQLLANHRDLTPDELRSSVGFDDSFHVYRQNGWRKYLTDNVETYVEARNLRSDIWSTTTAFDAFVTASQNGERISVQEALYLSNQSWIP